MNSCINIDKPVVAGSKSFELSSLSICCKCKDINCRRAGFCLRLASIESEYEWAVINQRHELCMDLMVRFNEVFSNRTKQGSHFYDCK